MNIIHLPPDAVSLLNALLGGGDTSVPMQSFLELRESVRRWIQFHGGYTLHDDDARRLSNIEFLWNEVDAALALPSPREILHRLLPALYQAVQAMDEVSAEREKPHFSIQRPVNDFLMATAAFVLGRAEPRAVLERVPVMEDYLLRLESMVGDCGARLKPEVSAELDKGLAAMRSGLGQVRDAVEGADLEGVQSGMALLDGGAGLMQGFLDWEHADQRRLAERHRRFNIPVVGPMLELGLESARTARRSAWAPAVRNARLHVLPLLLSFWRRVRSGVLLPRDVREERLGAIDAALVGLDSALLAMLNSSTNRDGLLAGLEKALTLLSDAFTALDREAVRRDGLESTVPGTYLEAIGGVLDGTVPDLALIILLRTTPLPKAFVPAASSMDTYLSDGNADNLLDAAIALACVARPAEQPAVGDGPWACPCCGHGNPQGTDSCRACGNRASRPADEIVSLEV